MRIKILSPRINGTYVLHKKKKIKTITEMKFFYLTYIYDVKIYIKASNMYIGRKCETYQFYHTYIDMGSSIVTYNQISSKQSINKMVYNREAKNGEWYVKIEVSLGDIHNLLRVIFFGNIVKT